MAKFEIEIIAFVLVFILATAATGAPPPNPSPSPPPPPQPTQTLPADCMGTLSQLLSCVPFLSGRAGAPPADCCRPFRDIVQRPERVCLCHALSGALSRFISTPISSIRLALLPLHCATLVPPSLFVNCVGKNYGVLITVFQFLIFCNEILALFTVCPVPPINSPPGTLPKIDEATAMAADP